jgi:hypothetical protein
MDDNEEAIFLEWAFLLTANALAEDRQAKMMSGRIRIIEVFQTSQTDGVAALP